MKSLLTITALFEGLTGLALVISPSLVVSVLLGTSLEEPSAILIARLAGTALVTIAIACWLSRNGNDLTIMTKAMIVYNIFSITLLIYASIVKSMSGPGLWPAVILHFGLLSWSLSTLLKPVKKIA